MTHSLIKSLTHSFTWLDSDPKTRELPCVAVNTAPPTVWSRNQEKAGRV